MSVSNLSHQIFSAKFDALQNGTQITDFPISFNISDMNMDFSPVFWDSNKDVALSGYKRSNIRGWDLIITLDYDTCLEPQKVKNILDQLPNAIFTNEYEFRFYPDENVADYVEVIPSSDIGYSISWNGTVRKGGQDAVLPSLSFESRRYRDTIDSFFQT